MSRTLRTFTLALLALPLAAQTPGFSVAGGPILGFDSLRKATNSNMAFQAGADYTASVPGSGLTARAGLSLGAFPGKERFGLKTSLTLVQAHGDILLPLERLQAYGIFGLALGSWSMSKDGTENTDSAEDIDHHFPVRDARGLKLGLRLGMGFSLSRALALEATLQQMELAGKDLSDPMVRQGGVNPGWLSLDVRYTF